MDEVLANNWRFLSKYKGLVIVDVCFAVNAITATKPNSRACCRPLSITVRDSFYWRSTTLAWRQQFSRAASLLL